MLICARASHHSEGHPASVHHQVVPGLVRARLVARQPAHRARNIGGRAEPLARRPVVRVLGHRTRRLLHDLTRRDAVARDQLLGVVDGDLLGHVDGGGLGGAVCEVARARHHAVLRGDVDQLAAQARLCARLLPQELLDGNLRAEEVAERIDAVHALPLLQRGRGQLLRQAVRWVGQVQRGVVDEDVEPTPPTYRHRDSSRHVRTFGHVAAHEQDLAARACSSVLLRRRHAPFERRLPRVEADHAAPSGRRSEHDPPADPRRASRHGHHQARAAPLHRAALVPGRQTPLLRRRRCRRRRRQRDRQRQTSRQRWVDRRRRLCRRLRLEPCQVLSHRKRQRRRLEAKLFAHRLDAHPPGTQPVIGRESAHHVAGLGGLPAASGREELDTRAEPAAKLLEQRRLVGGVCEGLADEGCDKLAVRHAAADRELV
mmetsp:Transcript_13/g.52  ORF Transcript_13/g.52 Transcript_13/m.52 type:complete len:429 (-) Transcript_13:770-2056(-)